MTDITMIYGLLAVLLGAAATLLVAWVRFYKGLATALSLLNDASGQIDALFKGNSYIRESHRLPVSTTVDAVLSFTNTLGWHIYATPRQKFLAAKARRFHATSTDAVKKANTEFVAGQLGMYSNLFDTIESKPLTPAQRLSCVVCEDNNLVLAGAGTGKTSTMIGRAGYLLASGRARPSDILMLAFARKARDEMQERQDDRLRQWCEKGTPTIKTFHALGLEIIGKAEGRRPDITPMAEDNVQMGKFITRQIDEHSKRPDYRSKLVQYLNSEMFVYRNPFDFACMADYVEYVRTNELRTLRGEKVKSFEECIIANFLSAHSVRYEYERNYPFATTGPDFRQYKPDFFLPDHNIYIEHFAIDRNGDPPPYFDRDMYKAGIRWKRDLHRHKHTKLLETYSYLKREGRLESYLTDTLQEAGITLVRKSDEELLAELRDSTCIMDFAETLSTFVVLFKESGLGFSDLREKAQAHEKDASRLGLVLDLAEPIVKGYQAELDKNGQIDFADMIRRATSHIESGAFESPYAHIMVDEFQDISSTRAHLVSALLRQRRDAILFVVGDDWQSIYRFAGSNIAYTRDFSVHFGPTAQTALDLTFRFNDHIGKVASKFILQNPQQIKKEIGSISQVHAPSVTMVPEPDNTKGLHKALEAIGRRSDNKKGTEPSVLVLGRFNFTVEDYWTSAAKREFKRRHPTLQIDFMTAHAAKGKEADYVIVLEVNKGKYGFPCEKQTDAILEFLLPTPEPYPHAEERRLFYVSITRARNRVYLVYNPNLASTFIQELLNKEYGYPICTDEVAGGPTFFVPCPRCGGSLVLRSGPEGNFAGCNNFPICSYKEPLCPSCGSLMALSDGGRKCTNPRCGTTSPLCPRCKGPMVKHTGDYGEFWSCNNYRTDSEFSCPGKINIKSTLRRHRRPHIRRHY